MSDRLTELLAKQAAQTAAEEARRESLHKAQLNLNQRKAAAAQLWPSKKAMISQCLERMNASLTGSGVSFQMQEQQTSPMMGDIAFLSFHLSGQSAKTTGHSGKIRITDTGSTRIEVNSANVIPWSQINVDLDELTDTVVDEFLLDLFEAKLEPTKAKSRRS